MKKYETTVYIRVNGSGCLTGISSDTFLKDTEGWIPIAKGCGMRYRHAQVRWLELPLCDSERNWNYRFENGEILLRTDEEKKAVREL